MVKEFQPHQIFRRHGQRDRVTNGLVEAVICTVPEKIWLLSVSELVEIVSKLMVNRTEVFRSDIDAHLQPNVFLCVDIPCARVANHLAILWLHEQRASPEC